MSANETAGTKSAEETAALVSSIKAKFNNKVDVVETKFRFKTVKLTAKMPDGTEKETGETFQRPSVEIQLPFPSVEGIIHILEKDNNEKELKLLLEAVKDVVILRAREIINDNENITQDNFPIEQLSWEAIANLPPAQRKGSGIAKEVWEDFGKDYLAVMPSVTGKKEEMIANAVKIYLGKFNSCKTNKPVISKLKDQLAIYLSNSPNAEQFSDCVEFLQDKAQNLLEFDESKLLENL